jgi:peptide/nickel transport system substrate-binding protein
MRRTFLLALAAGLLIAGLAGAAPKPLTWALSGNPDSLDPQKTAGTLTFQTVRSLYDTLVEPDAKGQIVGALAERWQTSADNLTWTFTLRKG